MTSKSHDIIDSQLHNHSTTNRYSAIHFTTVHIPTLRDKIRVDKLILSYSHPISSDRIRSHPILPNPIRSD